MESITMFLDPKNPIGRMTKNGFSTEVYQRGKIVFLSKNFKEKEDFYYVEKFNIIEKEKVAFFFPVIYRKAKKRHEEKLNYSHQRFSYTVTEFVENNSYQKTYSYPDTPEGYMYKNNNFKKVFDLLKGIDYGSQFKKNWMFYSVSIRNDSEEKQTITVIKDAVIEDVSVRNWFGECNWVARFFLDIYDLKTGEIRSDEKIDSGVGKLCEFDWIHTITLHEDGLHKRQISEGVCKKIYDGKSLWKFGDKIVKEFKIPLTENEQKAVQEFIVLDNEEKNNLLSFASNNENEKRSRPSVLKDWISKNLPLSNGEYYDVGSGWTEEFGYKKLWNNLVVSSYYSDSVLNENMIIGSIVIFGAFSFSGFSYLVSDREEMPIPNSI